MPNLRNILISAFSLFVIAYFSVSIQAKVAPAAIEDLIKRSDLIVVGKVSSVTNIEGADFANVEISQTLKGASYTNIYYSAERTWACDVSAAVTGETALFFFNKYEIKPILLDDSQKPFPFQKSISFKETVEKLTNNTDLFRLSFNGRGRIVVEETNGEILLRINGGVILPKELKPELTEIINYTNKVLSNN